MKTKTIISTLILIQVLMGCDFNSKTPHEVYRERQVGKTDDELLEEILNKPMMYKVSGHSIKNETGYDFEDKLIQDGAVLQVIFSKNSLYIEKFGTYNGDYKQGYFANSDGTESIKIVKDYLHLKPYDDSPLGRLKAKNETININMNLTLKDEVYSHTARVLYTLERM